MDTRAFGTGPQTRIAATRLAWTAVILNSCETTSGPLSNGRALKMCSVYKIFWRPKGGFARTPSNPPLPIGLMMHSSQ